MIRINHAPVASAGPDIDSGRTTVSFDASQSADADGDALTYRWDFGDGTPPAGGAEVTHTYATGGAYPVMLTVDDGTGLWNATASAAITVVINRPPVAVAGANKDACAGDIVVFDGSGSQDPDGGLLRYSWDFGDGTGADLVNPTKIYTHGGVYPVTLSVEDESGFPNNSHTARMVVRVDESPIAVAGPDQMACANAEVRFDGSASRDFDGVVNRYSWNFGDNNISGGEKPVHVYREPGDYRVVLTIQGDQAGQCDNSHSDEMTVRVVEAPVSPDRRARAHPGRRAGGLRRQRLVRRRRRDRRLALGLRRRQHGRGPGCGASLRGARRLCRQALDRDRFAHLPVQHGHGAAADRRERGAAGTGRRRPDGRRRPGGAVRRFCFERCGRRDHRLSVGLRRRHAGLGHERAPSVRAKRPLSRDADRDRRYRPAEQRQDRHRDGHGQPGARRRDRSARCRLPRRGAGVQRGRLARWRRPDHALRMGSRRRHGRHRARGQAYLSARPGSTRSR